MFSTAALLFLKNNWLYVAIGVVFLLMMGYIGILKWEVSSLKEDVAERDQIIAVYKTKEKELKKENQRITEAHATTLQRYADEIKKSTKAIQEKIAANEELKRVRLSLELVQLWNESKRNPDSKDTTTTKQGDDGKATGTPTLEDLFRASAENDARHWACVKQVNEWIDFWTEYSQAVRLINPE